MFKFATNKIIGGGSSSGSSAGNAKTSHHLSILNDDSSSSGAVARRRHLQKDLFAFNKIADKGFPAKPSAMDYDRKLRLIAIGTKNGDIRVYGAPGTVQQQMSSYQDVHPFPILRLLFVQGQHQLITVSERVHRNDQTNRGEAQLYLVLWQIPNHKQLAASSDDSSSSTTNSSVNIIEKVKEYQLEPKITNGTRLSAITLLNDNSHIFLGFETGDIYVFNVSTFKIVPGVINKDYILKNLPEPSQSNNSSSSSTTTTTTTTAAKKLTSLGAVESICHHPRQLTKLLLAYQRGLWVIFDFIKNHIDQINQTQQQLESAVFYQNGECIATAHSDGSFILWDIESSANGGPSNSAPNIVYGPYPCKAVTKCFVKTCRNDQPYVIFSGGCPRVNYSDKITISVIQGENSHVCFDFTSKIIEFFTIDKPSVEKQPTTATAGSGATTTTTSATSSSVTYDNPQALLVLLEEEFVAIDLLTEGWPQFRLPYLYSVHSSAVICTHYVNGISNSLYERLKRHGSTSELYSTRDWPVSSLPGQPKASQAATSASDKRDLLLTGHEDGSISFWDVTQMSMVLIYRLRTSDYFQTDSTPMDDGEGGAGADDDTDNWPPFRKAGTFDPYSDDPKLGIQKIYLCAAREVLVVAGTAGQVLIMYLKDQPSELAYSSLSAHKINIIGVSPEVESHFIWKGHEALQLRGHLSADEPCSSGTLKLAAGYQLHSLIQLYPPATVSALSLNSDWQLVAIGTSHGFVLFDYMLEKDLLVRCTLDPAMLLQANNPNDSGNTGTISRRKSLKKSLRESFRKLRRGRSQKPNPKKNLDQLNNPIGALQNNKSSTMRVEHLDDDMNDAHKPIERQVESREFKPVDDIPPSVIRYMYFVRTYITSTQQQTNSLWVGTNTGVIYIYALQFLLNSAYAQQQLDPSAPKSVINSSYRSNQSVNCLLAKEMRLKHKAPVVHIQVIDQNMQPLPLDPSNVTMTTEATAVAPVAGGGHDTLVQNNHKVIICSEEQFKVFQLPTLKPVCKFKLTAIEGARVRRIGYNCYVSRSDPKYSEYCLSCLSNLGDLSVYSLPQLKRQVQIQCMKQQDINAITSFVFSKLGQAFYLQSPSEFIHISMSARDSPQVLAPQTNTMRQTTPTSGDKSSSSSSAAASAQKKPTNGHKTNESAESEHHTKSGDGAAKSVANGTAGSKQPTTNNKTATTSGNQLQKAPVPAPRTIISSSSTSSNAATSPKSSTSNTNNNNETR